MEGEKSGEAPLGVTYLPQGRRKRGVIHRYRCDQPGCIMEYIGKTGRNFGERYMEHLRAPYPIFDYSQSTGHLIKL